MAQGDSDINRTSPLPEGRGLFSCADGVCRHVERRDGLGKDSAHGESARGRESLGSYDQHPVNDDEMRVWLVVGRVVLHDHRDRARLLGRRLGACGVLESRERAHGRPERHA